VVDTYNCKKNKINLAIFLILKNQFMKKFKFMSALFAVTAGFLTFFACTSDKTDPIDNENIIASKLSFRYYTPDRTTSKEGDNYYISPSTGKLVIVNWTEWGHASANCRGWGLCHAKWFYFERDAPIPRPDTGYSVPLQHNVETDEYYIEVLLDETPDLPDGDVPDLKIDSDIPLDTALEIGKDLVLKMGSYSYDPNLGEYGGIHITLE
jgi:hypothetical protein